MRAAISFEREEDMAATAKGHLVRRGVDGADSENGYRRSACLRTAVSVMWERSQALLDERAMNDET